MKRKIVCVLALLFCLLPILAEEGPMDKGGWHTDSYYGTQFYRLSYQYREQDGYAMVQGRKLHYWLYDSITYKNKHGGDTSIIYNQVIPNWLEDMGYVIDYDNIVVEDPNPALANSVRMLMKQRGADISVTLVTDGRKPYACINEYFPSKDTYKFTEYPLYN